MELLKGMPLVKVMREEMKVQVNALEKPPVLAIIRVGEREDDMSYERGAKKRMASVGIDVVSYVFPGDISNDVFQKTFSQINRDAEIDGILLLRPLPKQIDEEAITKQIDPYKDVDCISPVNMAKIFMGDKDSFAPCTAEAVVRLAKNSGIELSGKRAVIIGRSLVVGKPLSMLLLQENCTVTICHSKTKNLAQVAREADILIAAIGRAKMVDRSYIKENALVLDVGIHVLEDGSMCGDIDFASAEEVNGTITPVPGGVGTVTTSILAEHVIKAAGRKK